MKIYRKKVKNKKWVEISEIEDQSQRKLTKLKVCSLKKKINKFVKLDWLRKKKENINDSRDISTDPYRYKGMEF